ncbi:hypothetical protein MMC14_007680 [Varicellaria rhodocarpa]|nr:hypothetical protein [Varicellaria rhodocarpa]
MSHVDSADVLGKLGRPTGVAALGTKDIVRNVQKSDEDSHKSSNPLDPVSHHMSPFKRIPLELREHIYQYLLVSHHVKKPSPDLQAGTYRFQLALLCTNRFIAQETRPFLQKNIFVLVTTSQVGIYKRLKNEGVPVVSNHHVTLFTDHLLSVHFDFPKTVLGPAQTFLMMADDLPLLCRFIQIQNILTAPSLKSGMNIRLKMRTNAMHKEPALPIQTLLLDPFKFVYGEGVWSDLDTSDYQLDAKLDTILESATSYKSLSAKKWSAYQLCKGMKREGDAAYRLGKWERARERYIAHTVLFRCFRDVLPFRVYQIDDGIDWRIIAHGLDFRTMFNRLLLSIRSKKYELELAEVGAKFHMPGIPWYDRARMEYYVGLIFAELGKNTQAARLFMEALRSSSGNVAMYFESFERVRNSREEIQHLGISECVLGDPIIEEGGESQDEMEFGAWQKMFRATQEGHG